ncbi:MAG: 3' terminal RNA ribose 2'-O-methyltransferase Hen1 [Planctomycetota bacterium]
MLLTITYRGNDAKDLGFLLAKHPDRLQSFTLSFGQAHVFYPEASDECCTAALLLEVDPVGLVRGRKGPGGEGFSLQQYVNDRPFVASSFLSVALSQVFTTALQGKCKQRQELAERALDLELELSAVPCRGGEELLRRLFEPLGYEVTSERVSLDDRFPDWGDSRYHCVRLKASVTLAAALSHLYVLVPVLDNDKHYFVSSDEVEKLLRRGEAWLPGHPEKNLITRRYLKHQKALTRQALTRLTEDQDVDAAAESRNREEAAIERPLSLNEQRLGSVVAALRAVGARSVVDLGCGEGRLIRELLKDTHFERIVGVDVSMQVLNKAKERLRVERMPEMKRRRLELRQGSALYRDRSLEGFDAAAVVEVIEHLDPPVLEAFEKTLFRFARPRAVVVTTPNVEYNVKFEGLPAGTLRHRDHRFEWTRVEFRAWSERVAEKNGYQVRFLPIGPEDATLGSPTQMGVFER